jgi:hypothetical protein
MRRKPRYHLGCFGIKAKEDGWYFASLVDSKTLHSCAVIKAEGLRELYDICVSLKVPGMEMLKDCGDVFGKPENRDPDDHNGTRR